MVLTNCILNTSDDLSSVFKKYQDTIKNVVIHFGNHEKKKGNKNTYGSELFTTIYATHNFYKSDELILEVSQDLSKCFSKNKTEEINPTIIPIVGDDRIKLELIPNEDGLNELIYTLVGKDILKKIDTFNLAEELSLNSKNKIQSSKRNKI